MRRVGTLALLAALWACEDTADTSPPARGDAIPSDGEALDRGAADRGGGDGGGAGADADAAVDAGPPRVPLAPDSPWPKFRQNPQQDGVAPVTPSLEGGALWAFPTGKGIFSTPVVGGDGTVYVGSADRVFYALNPDGTERWRFETGEIIDSSALLDDRGRVYVGSGDGFLYCLDAATGQEVWRFEADDPRGQQAFINWFEGNVAMGPDGTLYVPNDNFFVYALDRDDGAVRWRFRMRDQTWSLPAVDAATGRLYVGNNNLLAALGDNTFAIDADGTRAWSAGTDGSVAASPLLTPEGLVVVGGFDGFLRAYEAATGAPRWVFGARDHLYASPGRLPDGTLVQPAADGTIYGLDPANGRVRWAFDTREAIRSSPAIDAEGNVYVGSGEGRLFVLRADGTLRWSMQLIEGDRNDLNASPALGVDAVYIAGESGEVFSVPLDYCLRPEAMDDARCTTTGGEGLAAEGARLLFTTHFGSALTTPPDTIEANQPLAFSLLLREGGDTRLALIDTESVEVTLDPPKGVRVEVSANRAFLTVRPDGAYAADGDGRVRITVAADYLVDPERTGLRFEGGARGGRVEETFDFAVAPGTPGPLALALPAGPGEAGGVWELHRLAAPLPTILPSYNQIGFDSLHYLVALVEGDDEHAVAWVLGGRLDAMGRTVPDPATKALFPLSLAHDEQRVTLTNRDGLGLEVLNARIAFDDFHVAARVAADGSVPRPAQVVVSAVCGDIPLYGAFLQQLGFCNPVTDVLHVFGAALLRPWDAAGAPSPPAVAEVAFEVGPRMARATFLAPSVPAEAHAVALLLIDPDSGRPVSLDYGPATRRTLDAEDRVQSVSVAWPADAELPPRLRLWLMIDTWPMAAATLDRPAE